MTFKKRKVFMLKFKPIGEGLFSRTNFATSVYTSILLDPILKEDFAAYNNYLYRRQFKLIGMLNRITTSSRIDNMCLYIFDRSKNNMKKIANIRRSSLKKRKNYIKILQLFKWNTYCNIIKNFIYFYIGKNFIKKTSTPAGGIFFNKFPNTVPTNINRILFSKKLTFRVNT